jgi:hypothetical protein
MVLHKEDEFYSSEVEPSHKEAPTNMDENSFIRE